jgi:multisubunit Na+/H+ antiporter MnhG subunit
MGLDIRIPLGLIFLIIGGIMAAFGLFTHGDAALYERSLGVDLNLTWGVLMFIFGGIMYFVGRRQKWQDDPVNPRPWEKGDVPAKPRH